MRTSNRQRCLGFSHRCQVKQQRPALRDIVAIHEIKRKVCNFILGACVVVTACRLTQIVTGQSHVGAGRPCAYGVAPVLNKDNKAGKAADDRLGENQQQTAASLVVAEMLLQFGKGPKLVRVLEDVLHRGRPRYASSRKLAREGPAIGDNIQPEARHTTETLGNHASKQPTAEGCGRDRNPPRVAQHAKLGRNRALVCRRRWRGQGPVPY